MDYGAPNDDVVKTVSFEEIKTIANILGVKLATSKDCNDKIVYSLNRRIWLTTPFTVDKETEDFIKNLYNPYSD